MTMCICLCVCLSVSKHIFGTACPTFTKFLRMLPMALAQSSSDGVVIRCVQCTSGFMYDVILAIRGNVNTAVAGDVIPSSRAG